MSHACHTQLDRRRIIPAAVLAFVALAILALSSAARADEGRVRVIVPGESNLQLLAFWVARGAGYFEQEGVGVDLVVPPAPALAQSMFTNGDAPAALLPRPMALRLAQERFAFVVVANLMTNDPIDLVVSRKVAEARGISRAQPLADRLRALHGLRVGIAPNPGPRLRALYRSQGLDADAELQIVVIHGKDQNDVFARGEVDALYAHTPYLERALLDEDAVLIVDQSSGEVPELAGRDIHVLAVTRALVEQRPRAVAAMVRAIAHAESLVHRDQTAAVDAVLRALPNYDRAHVARLVSIYAPALPETPHPSAIVLEREVALYPEMGERPDLRGVDLAQYVDERFSGPAVTVVPARSSRGLGALAALFAVALALLVAFAETRESGPKNRK